MINIAIMGHGVVGSGVVEVLLNNNDGITSRAAEEINIKHILDLREFPDSPLSDRFTKDFNDILNDESVKIVVESMARSLSQLQRKITLTFYSKQALAVVFLSYVQ